MLTVQKLSSGDREAWETLFRAYIDFYERSLEAGEYDRAWARFMADDEIHLRGASIDGRLVGIVHFFSHPHSNAADVCYLQDLFTTPEVRGQGVGRALINEVVAWAQERDCSRVYWHTKESNAPARRLYDQVARHAGFIVYQVDL